MVYKSEQIFLPFCHNLRVWRTDRRIDIDRQTEFSSLYRVCIPCSAVKMHTGYSSRYTKISHTVIYVSQPMSMLFNNLQSVFYQSARFQFFIVQSCNFHLCDVFRHFPVLLIHLSRMLCLWANFSTPTLWLSRRPRDVLSKEYHRFDRWLN